MATFRITDPQTGQVLQVTGDSPPTEQELVQLFASQRPAVAVRPTEEQQRQELFRRRAEETGVLETLAVGAGRGLTTLGRGLGLVEPEDPLVTQQFAALQEERPIATTVGEVAGQAAPFLIPGGAVAQLASVPARVAAATGLGAAEGALITRGEGGSLEQQLTGGGVGGTVAGVAEVLLPRIATAGSKIIRRVLGREPIDAVVDAAGRPSREFAEALDKSGLTIDDVVAQERRALAGQAIDPEQAARQAALEAQGLRPTKAQISRTAADFQAQQEAAKTSGIVREALEEQEAVLTSRFDNAVLATGGDAVTPTSTVTDALVSKATVLDQEISDLYKIARDAAGGRPNVTATSVASTLRSLKGQDKATGGAISAIKSDLMDKGVINKKFEVIGSLDVKTAEDARKVMNQLFDPQQPFRNIKIRQLKDAIDDDVFRSAGDDVFQQARGAKAKFETDLSRAKISKFDSRKQNLVRDVLENKIDPDQFSDKIVFAKKYRADDLQQLKDYIGADEAGQQAFKDLKADVMQKIKEMSFIGPDDAAGNKALSRNSLQKALAKIGKKKMDVLFDVEEQKFLNDMLTVSKLREPVRGTQQGLGPSAQAITRLKASIRQNPKFAAIIDAITFDSQGRAVLKAKPERVVRDITPRAREIQQAIGQTGAVAAVGATQQEQ